MSDEGLMLRRLSSSLTSPVPVPVPVPVPTPPLDDDNILREILLRIPPQPSSLSRASLVCKRWFRLVSDPRFLGRFREHHRKPRILGFFALADGPPSFTPILPPPDRIPEGQFSLPQSPDEHWDLVDCRHGLVLLLDRIRLEALVWDPLTGHQRRVAFPPGLDNTPENFVRNAAVLCAAAGEDVHRDSRLSPFKLVLVRNDKDRTRAFSCIYESKSGLWGDAISATITDAISEMTASVLVGNSLFWLFSEGDILELDFERQSLVVIKKPADAHVTSYSGFQILQTEESGLGFAVFTEMTAEIWQRKIKSNGVAGWVMQKTIELGKLLLPGSPTDHIWVAILGYLEGNNVLFLWMDNRVFMVQLELMTFKNLFQSDSITTYYPYTSFYAAGTWSRVTSQPSS